MSYRTFFKLLFLLLFFAVIFIVAGQLKERTPAMQTATPDSDGLEMRYIAFNSENQKALSVTASESIHVSERRMLMKNIRATIYQEGRLSEDLHIRADEGYSEDEAHHFYIEGNARIQSEEMDIRGHHFYLKNRSFLQTDTSVDYAAKGLEGVAQDGMEFYSHANVLKFFNTEGKFLREDPVKEYRTSLLWYIEEEKRIVMEKNTELRDPNNRFTSDRLQLMLDDELKQIEKTISYRGSRLDYRNDESGETRELRCRRLTSIFNTSGKITKSIAQKNAHARLVTSKRETEIRAPYMAITYNETDGSIKNIRLHLTANVISRGETDFSITARQIYLGYRDGELENGEAKRDCKFQIDDYSGTSEHMGYNAVTGKIHLKGQQATVIQGNQRFISTDFFIETKKDILYSDQGIQSFTRLENQSALFNRDKIFITSRKIQIQRQKNSLFYEDSVRLYQGDTILKSDRLQITEDETIMAKGHVFLTFKDGEEEVILSGNQLTFDNRNRRAIIESGGAIRSQNRVLKGDNLTIIFNEENQLAVIRGKDEILFKDKDITGRSQEVEWLYPEGRMVFTGEARIENAASGTTHGHQLRLDLNDNQIVILSDDDKRSETVIKQP